MKIWLMFLMLALTAGCASTYRPLVDTKGVDMNRYEADLRECREYTQQLVGPGEQAATGAVVGAATGALVTRIVDRDLNRGPNTRLGALLGAVGGLARGAQEQYAVIRNCMAGRGYRVLQ